jgi:hypothetical protein
MNKKVVILVVGIVVIILVGIAIGLQSYKSFQFNIEVVHSEKTITDGWYSEDQLSQSDQWLVVLKNNGQELHNVQILDLKGVAAWTTIWKRSEEIQIPCYPFRNEDVWFLKIECDEGTVIISF